MKKTFIKIFIFIMIIFLCPKVFADDFNVSSTITSPANGSLGGGHYASTEIYNTGAEFTYGVGTRYNGQISTMRFNVPIPSNWPDGSCYSSGDITYTLTLNMATDDWRNRFATPFISSSSTGTNWATSQVVYVNYRKIYFNFKIPSSTSCIDFLYVRLNSTNILSTAFTGVSNWNLSSVILTANFPTGGGSSGGGSSGATNQDIINNNNTNTNNIINNQNNNTNNLIENNNQNANDIKDTITDTLTNKCDNLINPRGYSRLSGVNSVSASDTSFTFSGVSSATASNYVAYDLNVNSNTTFYLSVANNPNIIYVFDSNYNVLAVLNNGSTSTTFNTGNNNLIRVLFYANGTNSTTYSNMMLSTTTSSFCKYGSSTNKLDTTNQSINDVNNSINNDNIDSGVGSDFFSDFQDNSHGLTSIITAPLTAIASITSSTCQPLSIPIPFTNGSVSLPCMTQVYQDNIPTIYNIWKVVSFGIIAYFICVDIFHIVKGFKDPESDKVEVLDL